MPRRIPPRAIEGRSQWQLTWRRLRSDKVAIAALIVVLIIVVLAIAAPVFVAITHHPPNIAYPNTGEDVGRQPGRPGHQRLLARHRRHRP